MSGFLSAIGFGIGVMLTVAVPAGIVFFSVPPLRWLWKRWDRHFRDKEYYQLVRRF